MEMPQHRLMYHHPSNKNVFQSRVLAFSVDVLMMKFLKLGDFGFMRFIAKG